MRRAGDKDGPDVRAAPSVMYVQFTDPAGYPPLEHGALLLAEAGCRVHLVGIDLTHGALTLASHPRVSEALLKPEPPGWRQKVQFLRFVWWSLGEARRCKPTWIYASDTLSTPAAVVLRWVTGAQTIYHEHDAPPEAYSSIFMRLAGWCRRSVLRHASAVIVPSHERGEMIGGGCLVEIATVRNAPLLREVRGPRLGVADGRRLRALYHGSIVPARLPVAVIDALAELPVAVTLTIAGYDPSGGHHLAALRARAQERGVGDRLHIAGTVPTRRALLDLAASCDIGLAFMPSVTHDANEQTMVGASNKPFDYLACGLALLVSDLPAWRDMYVAAGYGLACVPESATDIASKLRWFLEHPTERVQMGEAGRQRVLSEWYYEREFGSLVTRIAGHAAVPIESVAASNAAVGA